MAGSGLLAVAGFLAWTVSLIDMGRVIIIGRDIGEGMIIDWGNVIGGGRVFGLAIVIGMGRIIAIGRVFGGAGLLTVVGFLAGALLLVRAGL